MVEATQILLKNKNFKKLFELYLDLIYNRIVEIGISLNIRAPNSNEKIHEYMILIDNFLNLNFKIKIFQDISERVKKFWKMFDRFNHLEEGFMLDKYDVKEAIDLYFKIKEIKIPNIDEEIYGFNNAKLGLSQPIETYKYIFSKGGKNLQSLDFNKTYSEVILSRIENESDDIRSKYERGKINFEKCFKKLSVLNSVKKSVETSKKNPKKFEIKGKLSQSLEYTIFSENLYGYFVLALAIISSLFLVLIGIESYIYPVLIGSLSIYAFMLAILSIFLFYYFIKNYVC